MNILFVMKHRGNAGNTHAIADYIRVARKFGHRVALFGYPVPWLPELEFSLDVTAFDKVVFLFESEIYRVARLHEAALFGRFERADRMILDMDGMYNPVIVLDGYDRNHDGAAQRAEWITYFDTLADRVMKPVMGLPPGDGNVGALPFYGYDAALELDPAKAPEKEFDIVYVGHNWWRWRELEQEVFPALEPIRDNLGRIALIGLWWDAPPSDPGSGNPLAFAGDAALLQRLRIETLPSVMYNEVVDTMSRARINIFTQRPVLHHLRHLTLKYFEIFYADTIPLLLLDAEHAAAVYGPAGRELTLKGRAREKLADALARPDHYRGLVHDVRRHLAHHHGYESRMHELVAALG